MKGRSHRLPINDAPDDWGDGSWTVDCVCGVNFDDGEEMVNCDECGVWVHTRCSRFKGDDSFACDRCKRKKSRNDNEEEVAQLLVELPTKTLAMDPPSAPSLSLWTEIPFHQRAHVHGIPGGDPALFRGISSVFTPELWKCSGYVPKKFNFQYREFPCWDRDTDRDDKPKAEDNDNPVDRGADALFSLSKEIVSPNPVDMLVGLRGSVKTASRDRDRDKSRKEGKKREADDSTVKHVHNNGVKRETNTIPSPSHLGKRKKENIRTKDIHSGKKKARSASKIIDGKRRVSITSIGTQIESHRVGEPKAVEKEFQSSVRVNKLSLDHATPDSCLDGNKSKTKGHLPNSSHYTEDSIKKTKHKDGVAAAAYHVEDSLQKVKSRDNLAVIGDDSSKKLKPRVGLEVNNHHANDLIRKKSKDKSLVKSHHFDDSSKMVKTKDNLTTSAYRGEDSKEAWKNSSLVEIVVKSEDGHQAPTRAGSSSDTVAIEVSLLEPNGISPVKDYQGLNTSVDNLDCPSDVKHDRRDVCRKSSTTPLSSPKLKPSIGERSNVIPAMQDSPSHEDSMNGMLTSSLKSSLKVKTEASVDHSTGNSGALSSPTIDAKLDSMKQLKITVPEDAHENNLVHKTHIGSVLSDEAAVTELKAVIDKNNGIEGTIPISGEPCQNKEVVGSAGTLSGQESSEFKHFKSAEEPSKTGVVKSSSASPLSQRRVVAAFGKSSPSTTVLISKSEVSGSCKPPGRPASPSTLRPIHFTKRVKANSNLCADIKKDHTAVDAAKDEFKQEEPKKAAKEQLKSSAVSASKLSHMSRVSHAAISKRPILDPKEPVLCPSPKPPVPQNVTVTSSSIEAAKNVSPAQNKTPALSSSERSERSNQSGSQQSPKVAPHSSSMHPPPPVNSSSTLSDEELALLLHQELNSSPRVPRVPRMRHASSIPQAPPTPASMLIKRTSGSGLKDHISVLRRKNKEDGYRNSSRELIDETKKSNGLLSSSHGHRKQDQAVVSDACAKKEGVDISPDTAKRPATGTTATNSGNSEATEQNLSSMRNSPGNTSDDDYNDDTSAVAGPATRTLPGLLDEIMSKGKRMTYEELCNAVLPHWSKLRKHNGERYAYSSHSQAVLDCLRNRNEWAQLVDRGPKTTGGRKKRSKVEEEEAEEEEGEYGGRNKSRSSNVVEDFPKGKRKARKRRRLALQGRGIREVRKNKRQQKTTSSSSEEEEDSSAESSESMFSEDGSMEEEGVVG